MNFNLMLTSLPTSPNCWGSLNFKDTVRVEPLETPSVNVHAQAEPEPFGRHAISISASAS
jgi:hypothetical protein